MKTANVTNRRLRCDSQFSMWLSRKRCYLGLQRSLRVEDLLIVGLHCT